MTYLTYATHQQLTDDQASVSEYVRRSAATAGVSDPEQLTDLELTYRHRINTHLRGTGLVLVGDNVVGPAAPTDQEIRAQVALEEHSGTSSPAAGAVQYAQLTRADLGSAMARQSPGLHLSPQPGLGPR